MTQFSTEFNCVYRDALKSATDLDVAQSDVAEDMTGYIEGEAAKTVNIWQCADRFGTDVNFNQVESAADKSEESLIIRHPNSYDGNIDQARDVARIRYFGKKVIEATQLNMESNPFFNFVSGTDCYGRVAKVFSDDLTEALSSQAWCRSSVNDDSGNSPGVDDESLCPNPHQIGRWPGEYINCLGVAEALTAVTGIDERQTFVNVIRPIDNEALQLAADYRKQTAYALTRGLPGGRLLLNQTRAIAAGNQYDRAQSNLNDAIDVWQKMPAELHSQYYNHQYEPTLHLMNSETDSLASLSDGLWQQFHHSVLVHAQIEGYSGNTWLNLDPYQLRVGGTFDNAGHNAFALDQFTTSADIAANDVLLLRNNKLYLQDDQFRLVLELAAIFSDDFDKMLDKERESDDLLHSIELRSLGQGRWNGLIEAAVRGNVNGVVRGLVADARKGNLNKIPDLDLGWDVVKQRCRNDDQLVIDDGTWMIVKGLLDGSTNDIINKMRAAKTEKSFATLQRTMRIELLNELRTNDNKWRQFKQLILAIPYINALMIPNQQFADYMFSSWQIDSTIEVGDPAFQIGSMYLNHYAKSKKDVTVNVAAELAMVNPSQLIWQSAVSYNDEHRNDDSVIALEGIYKSLRQRWRNPLVNISL